jgi:beta-phosphoglucomutase
VTEKFKAILFDFDGVLGKTMDDNYAAWVKALSAYDIPLEAEDYYLQEGRKASEIAEYAARKHNFSPETIAQITDLKDTNYLNNNNFSFYEGVNEIITWARDNKYKIGVVSGGSKKRLLDPKVRAVLDSFDLVITASDYSTGKPSPEPYLAASKKLNVIPSECLVIENAPLGIEAAKKAGMKCIAISTTLEPKHLSEADCIVNSIKEVKEACQKLVN